MGKQRHWQQGTRQALDIWKHFAHEDDEVIQNGHMKLVHVSTMSHLVDKLTKPLLGQRLETLLPIVHLRYDVVSMWCAGVG